MTDRSSIRQALGRRITPPAPISVRTERPTPAQALTSVEVPISVIVPPQPPLQTSNTAANDDGTNDSSESEVSVNRNSQSSTNGYTNSISIRASQSGAFMSPSLPHRIVFEGALRKRSPKGLKLWQSRHCVLFTDAFAYYKKKTDYAQSIMPQGTLPLHHIKLVHQCSQTGKTNRFDVIVGETSIGRTFHMEANSNIEAEVWVNQIGNAMKAWSSSYEGVVDSRLAAVTMQEEKFWKNDRKSVHADGNSVRMSGSLNRMSRLSSAQGNVPLAPSLFYSPSISAQPLSPLPPLSPLLSVQTMPFLPSPINIRRSVSNNADINGRRNFPPPSPSNLTVSPRLTSSPALSLLPQLTTSPLPIERSISLVTLNADLNIEIVHQVGDGPTGEVYLTRDRKTVNDWFSLHTIKSSSALSTHAADMYERMSVIDHPCISRMLYHGRTSDSNWAIFTPAFRPRIDTLSHYLSVHRRLPESVVRYIAASCVSALSYLHTLGLTMKHFSPDTICIDGAGAITLTDYTLSLSSSLLPLPTAEYQTPDIEETFYTDWFRLGILLYECAVGLPPFRSLKLNNEEKCLDINIQLKNFIPNNLLFPPFISENLKNFIKQLLSINAMDRINGSITDEWNLLTQLSYFTPINWHSLQVGDITANMPTWIQVNCLNLTKENESLKNNNNNHHNIGLPNELIDYLSQSPPKNLSRQHQLSAGVRCGVEVTLLTGRDLPTPAEPTMTAANINDRRRTADKAVLSAYLDPVGVYATIRIDQQIFASELICGADAVTPSFNEQFSFTLPPAHDVHDTNCTIELRHDKESNVVFEANSERGTGLFIGSMTIPLLSVKSSYPQPLCIWHSVIDRDGLPRGEVQVQYLWQQIRESVSAAQPEKRMIGCERAQVSHRTFAAFFAAQTGGTADLASGNNVFRQSFSTARTSSVRTDPDDDTALTSDDVDDGNDGDGEYGDGDFSDDSDSETESSSVAPSETSIRSKTSAISTLSSQPQTLVEARRYYDDTHNLSLSYITPRLIAMAAPSTAENPSKTDNAITSVISFLSSVHTDHWHIYNLSNARRYAPALVGGHLSDFICMKNAVPPINLIIAFCHSMQSYLNADSKNVAAVHAQSDLSRCAIMISCYLLYSGAALTVDEAVNIYYLKRTVNGDSKSLTNASYRRYISYFAMFMQRSKNVTLSKLTALSPLPLRVTTLRMWPPPLLPATTVIHVAFFGAYPSHICLYDTRRNGLASEHINTATSQPTQTPPLEARSSGSFSQRKTSFVVADETNAAKSAEYLSVEFNDAAVVYGDVHVQVITVDTSTGTESRLLHCWIHTGFIQHNFISLKRHELDGLSRERNSKRLSERFKLEIHFNPVS